MPKKFPLTLTIVVGLISILAGAGLGAVIMLSVDNDTDNGNGGEGNDENNDLILRSDSADAANTVWDPEHHALNDLNGVLKGRVIMIELSVEDEEDQYHFLVLPDPDFAWMLNDENVRSWRGSIMVEIMKEDDSILPRLFIGQHLSIQGPFVTDIREGHGWNEIDPALIITAI
ncbi:MAG: hypothetical protein JXA22_06685 [Candidatus Thermoplasmatota archaeon]|nr:hypothetical protein [Candidatus Thermoplasmatota archaeon]